MENSDRNAEHSSAQRGMARRIWRPIALLWRIVWYSVSRILVLLFAIVLAVDIWLEWIGVPDYLSYRLAEKLSTEDFQVDFDMMQCGLVKGVVLHNVRCTAKTPAGKVRFKAERLAVRPDFRDLVNMEVFPQEFIVDNGNVTLQNPLDAGGGLDVPDIYLKCGLTVDERLTLNGRCSSFGLPLEVSAQLSEARGVLKRLMANTERKPVELNEELQRKLAEVTKQFRNLSLPSKDSSQLKVTVTGPMENFRRWKYNGSLYLQGARWSGLEIPYYRTAFHGNSQILSLDDMKLWLGRADIISGKADVFLGDKELQASCEGHLTRVSVEYILEGLKTLLKWESKPTLDAVPWNELSFSFAFNRSALNLESMDMEFSCKMPETDYGLLGKGSAKLSASLKEGKVELTEAEVMFSEAHNENLRLAGNWTIGTSDLKCNAKTRLNFRRCLAELGVTLPEDFVKLPEVPCEAEVEITFPNGTLAGVALEGKVEQKGGNLLGIDLSHMVIPFKLADGKASVNGLRIERTDGNRMLCGVDIECDVRAALQGGVARVDVKKLEIEGRERDDGPWAKALQSSGYVQWKMKGKRLSFKLAGKMYPESIYREYLRQYDFDETNMLMHIDCAPGSPAKFELEMPEKSLEDDTAWKVDGKLSFGKVRFNGLEIERIDCDGFTITEKNCLFKGLHAVTTAGDDASFDLHVVYSPLALTFSNTLLDGRPEIISYFIPDSSVSEFYMKIFHEITWNMAVRPHLQMPKLVYSYSGQQWRVLCDGIYANIHGIKYRELKIDEATMVITLNLPSTVIIEPLNVRLDDRSIRGKVELQLVGAKQCNFQVYDTRMGVDLRQVLEGLFPDMAEKFSDISISQDCILASRGSLFLDGEPLLNLEGTLKANEVVYREQSLQQVSLGWRYDDGDIWWDLKDAVMFAGNVKTSGHYNMERAQGQSLVIIKDISLNDFVGKLSKDEKTASSYHGNVSGELEVDILHGWAGRPLHLNGQGHVTIREGELWSIPILSKLGQIIKSASLGSVSAGLGQITELDADIELNGVNISVPNIRTNGTILSLNGDGDFRWDEDWRKGKLHLLINVIPVKDVKLLSFLLSPLTGMFQAELTGTLEEYSWKIRTFIDKLF